MIRLGCMALGIAVKSALGLWVTVLTVTDRVESARRLAWRLLAAVRGRS